MDTKYQSWPDIRGGVCGGVRSDEEVFVSIFDSSADSEETGSVSSFIVAASGEESRHGGRAVI